MENKINNTILSNNMINSGDTVIIGVSGGADSMCLLHFLFSNREKYNIRIIVAHINHCLRGEEAIRDEQFVEEFCSDNNITFKVLRANIKEISEKEGIGTEECGRQVRYGFFEKLAQHYGGKIATAHTASDNAETVLFNITRGTGLNGMCGIKPVRGNIIRPLISITRAEVEGYCTKHSVKYITDSTNLQCDYTRNVIRHKVVPVLKTVNCGFEQSVARLSNLLDVDNSYINSVAQTFIKTNYSEKGIKISKMQTLHRAVLSRVIIALTAHHSCYCLEQKHINLTQNIITLGSGSVNLPHNLTATTAQGYFRVINSKNDTTNITGIPIKNNSEINLFGKVYKFTVLEYKEYEEKCKFNKMLLNNSINYDIMFPNAVLRNRAQGDLFKKQGRGVTKSLKKLFNECKIPKETRSSVAIIANGENILWVEGFGASEAAKITVNTQNVLCIQILNNCGGNNGTIHRESTYF